MTTDKNTFVKYCPNVFLARCTEEYSRGDTANLTTRRGGEVEVEIFNQVRKGAGFYDYSFVRCDGINSQERAKAKAEKRREWEASRTAKSNASYEASKEGADFLSLAEPIKIGHHSEKRHRALIARNWSRMDKSVEHSNMAAEHAQKAEYYEKQSEKIDLSLPDCIEFFREKMEVMKANHAFLKDNPDKRPHGYSLQYALKHKKNAIKQYETAVALWG